MKFLSSIKSKLMLLLVVIGIAPLVIMMLYTSYTAINTALESAEEELIVQSDLIEKEVSAMLGNNLMALRIIAANPDVHDYLTAAPQNRSANMKSLVQNANALFSDESNIIVSDNSGQQLVRSDNEKLVNVSSRDYFTSAMKGVEDVSDVIVSKNTGLAIVVIEVPVKNSNGQVLGMVQRNYNISGLTKILSEEADEHTTIAIFDEIGKLVSHSSMKIEKEEDRLDLSSYGFIKEATADKILAGEFDVSGEKKLVSYTKEPHTNWVIATSRSYEFVEEHAYQETYVLVGMCVVMFLLIIAVATIVANKSVKPILTINAAANAISKGDLSLERVPVESTDELGDVANAFGVKDDRQA